MRFNDKVAFVTGAGTGIGRAIALRLSSEDAKVIVTDIDPKTAERTASEINKKNGTANSLKLDVTNSSEVSEVIEKSWKLYGRIDLLINNAGVSTMNRLVDLTERDWDFNMDVNAKGGFLVTVAAVRRMIREDYGQEKPKIVNVASAAGKIPGPFLAHYTASKFAVVGFTKTAALELAPFGINVNCVCPGAIDTPMLRWAANLDANPKQVLATCDRMHALGRMGKPEEVASAIAFLASDWASFITGAALMVDGGMLVPTGGMGFQEGGTGAATKS